MSITRATVFATVFALPFASAAILPRQDKLLTVHVGGALPEYDPGCIPDLVAGDTVRFIFKTDQATATESSFETPCMKVEGLFASGPQTVVPGQPEPYVDYHVPDNHPHYFYNGQGTACPHDGMVFAINDCGRVQQLRENAFATPPEAPLVTDHWVAPTYPTPEHVTATVTWSDQVWTTTYASYPGSGDPTPAPVPNHHRVIVGGAAGLIFDPPFIQADVHDIVTFEFRQKNHSVTQSSFNEPCMKLMNENGVVGFDSGFMPVAESETNFPTWEITVADTAPIWAYCMQTGGPGGTHCGSGMVFAINPNEQSEFNFANFQRIANATGTQPQTGNNGETTGDSNPFNPFPNSGSSLAISTGSLLATVSLAFFGLL